MNLDIESLLKPIPGNDPAGKDMLSSIEVDDLKEARRSDDPTVSQGDWVREIKKADWSRVEKIATDVITNKSKDLQFAVWLVEAWAQKYHFEGVNSGLVFLRRLLDTFWDDLYPKIEDTDLDYRTGPLDWLNNHLPSVIYSLSLGSGTVEKCSWQDIQQAREVENLGRIDPELKNKAMKEGKLSQDDVDKRLRNTPNEFILGNYELLALCRQNLIDLEKVVDEKYAVQAASQEQNERRYAPSLSDIRLAISNIYEFIEKVLKNRKLSEKNQIKYGEAESGAIDIAMKSDAENLDSKIDLFSAGAERKRIFTDGPIRSREEALRLVAEVSLFFKRTEPHSPIYYLLDRAVRWGSIPLDQWLNEMINEGWNDLPTLLRLIGKRDDPDDTSSIDKQ